MRRNELRGGGSREEAGADAMRGVKWEGFGWMGRIAVRSMRTHLSKCLPFPALRVKYCGIVKLNCFKIELKNEYASFSFYDLLNRNKVQINKAFGCLLNLNLKTFGS
jgi:hypothetical protein